ncbi:hypothetical protein H4R33_001546 [Dimargaris cristalligena]|nr:hypothetical protein H4R33_001546 [Dimargaris cristalligena]
MSSSSSSSYSRLSATPGLGRTPTSAADLSARFAQQLGTGSGSGSSSGSGSVAGGSGVGGGLSSSATTTGLGVTGLIKRYSVYGTEDRVVLDLGSHSLKCGFSGEAQPRAVIPLDAHFRWQPRAALPFTNRNTPAGTLGPVAPEVFGHLQSDQPGLYSLDLHAAPPQQLRDHVIYHLHRMFTQALMTDAKLRKVLICDSPLCPLPLKKLVADILFNHFQVPAVLYFPAPTLALLSTGTTTGLVVDCGHLEAAVLPVYDAHPLIHHIRTTPVAGAALGKHLRALLLEHATLLSDSSSATNAGATGASSSSSSDLLNSWLSPGVVEDIQCRLLFASPVRVGQPRGTPEERIRWYQEMTTTTDVDYPLPAPDPTSPLSTTITSSDPSALPQRTIRHLRIPGWIRERAAEIWFQGDPDQDIESIPATMLNVLLKVPLDLRHLMASTCLLTGSAASLPNFTHRLHIELRSLITSHPKYKPALIHLTDRFEFQDAKTNGLTFPRGNRTWIGGSLIGSVKCPGPEISRDDFKGEVPDWTLSTDC